MTTYKDPSGTEQTVVRVWDAAEVKRGAGYSNPGTLSVRLENTGNGYIAYFPSHSPAWQDYYVCLSYDQAYDLILALSAFKKELGFE